MDAFVLPNRQKVYRGYLVGKRVGKGMQLRPERHGNLRLK